MSAAPNHRRTKPGGIKPGTPSNGVVGPTSQIPGLSQIASESAPEARTSGRRVGIFASDSEYVKLAKQGGQKGLLSHDDIEAENQSPQNYNPSDWFSGPSGSQRSKSGSQASSPDMMSPDGHSRSQSKGSRHALAAPFGTDNCSSWERDTDSFAQGKEKVTELKSPLLTPLAISDIMVFPYCFIIQPPPPPLLSLHPSISELIPSSSLSQEGFTTCSLVVRGASLHAA
ncbi:uncharacterized protein C7orf57 homolog isoform X2 [Hypomesus transpacificus]|uniref:uncharacterized protein C7orf57 homolog isoform X2 n=1 Tax=Hypomesus transpacificus TaxID=137520 RepID=UPI001F07D785|nr:uncharacterized protein C7orf57 homolog isoform X2 [Hypomesus transpacificus]